MDQKVTPEQKVEIVMDNDGNTIAKPAPINQVISSEEAMELIKKEGEQTPEKAQEAALEIKPEEKLKPVRDEKGHFLPGNKEAEGLTNSGRPCEFCERPVEIMNKINLYREYCRGNVDGKPHLPYLQELVSEDYLDITMDQFEDWVRSERHQKEHSELTRLVKKIMNRQQLSLLRLAMHTETYRGAALQLASTHKIFAATKEYQAGSKDEPIEYKIKIVPKTQKQLDQENE